MHLSFSQDEKTKKKYKKNFGKYNFIFISILLYYSVVLYSLQKTMNLFLNAVSSNGKIILFDNNRQIV